MIAVGQLLAETALSPAQWDLVNTVRCSGEALLTLVTDILDFSRAEADRVALTPSEFAVGGAVEAAVDIAGSLAARKRLRVAYAVSSSVPPILVADAARLQQVLLNVLNNAVKFTEAGCVLLEVWADGTPRAGGRRPPQPLPAAAAAATALLGDDACTTTTTTTTPAWPGAASWPAPEASAAARPPLPRPLQARCASASPCATPASASRPRTCRACFKASCRSGQRGEEGGGGGRRDGAVDSPPTPPLLFCRSTNPPPAATAAPASACASAKSCARRWAAAWRPRRPGSALAPSFGGRSSPRSRPRTRPGARLCRLEGGQGICWRARACCWWKGVRWCARS